MKNATLGTLLACALLLACDGGVLTEIMVIIDSDIPVPAELDAVRVEVDGATDMIASGALTGADARSLPRTVGIVHRGGSFGPLRVRVFGTLAGADVVSAQAITTFIEGRTLVLPMFLSARCRPVSCGVDETCVSGACGSASVDSSTLADWTGGIPRLDGGSCATTAERCDGTDNDCDGMIDEDFDLQNDPMNCGGCTRSCARPNAVTDCSGGACSIVACNTGFDDCDADPMNGCEADVTSSITDCGACDNACTFPNATPACNAGTCALLSCNTGFDDCDIDPMNGCERPLNTLTDCGACNTACTAPSGTPTCATGTCRIGSCDPGLGDCNMDPSDGCETMTNTLAHCGACDTPCDIANATEACDTGACRVVTCDAGFGDCDVDGIDCETPLDTLANCGACGSVCGSTNASPSCATGACVLNCATLRGNCDMDFATGCETNLSRNDLHCGSCGNACVAPADRCDSGGVCR